SFEEIKVCIGLWPDACSAYIVKRRLIWRLPGVGFCPFGFDLASEPSSNDVVDGLADRKRKRDWRVVGSLSLWIVSVNRIAVYRVLFDAFGHCLTDDRITVA
ncbi:hypothetical protein, partial [Rhizobium binae]|uniref:hypothetical protein n=1 Tax=Rhizobium binae TaxID=1138190 RepID=UPI001C83F469